MSLDTLPADVMLLDTLTKHSDVPESTPSQDAFHPIEAQLRIYLANNSFTTFPSVLLQLTNLRVLSLRQNHLTNIPPAFERLAKLRTLNIAGNKLEVLPFELLNLFIQGQLREMIADPNPWRLVSDTAAKETQQAPYVRQEHHRTTQKLRRIAVGSEEYLRPNGSTVHQHKHLDIPAPTSTSFTPLTVMALNRISKLQSLQRLPEWIDENIPETVQKMLTAAFDSTKDGGRRCSSCSRDYVIPVRQRLEWWSIDFAPSGPFLKLPFLRKQCHRCVGQGWEANTSLWHNRQPVGGDRWLGMLCGHGLRQNDLSAESGLA